MISYYESVIYCFKTLDMIFLLMCVVCCESNGPVLHTFQLIRMIINLS